MQELHDAVEREEAKERERARSRARADLPLPPEMSGLWVELVARTPAGRFTTKRETDNAHE